MCLTAPTMAGNILVLLMYCGSPSATIAGAAQPPVASDPSTEERVRRLLDESRQARQRGDAQMAAATAKEARDLAEVSLDEDHPARARAQLIHALWSCELSIVRGDLDAALRWANTAALSPEADRPGRAPPIPPNDPDRLAALVTLGGVCFARREFPAALSAYRRAADAAGDQTPQRLHAEILAAGVEMQLDQADIARHASLLAEAGRSLTDGESLDPFYDRFQQRFVEYFVWQGMLEAARETARTGDADVAIDRLRKQLDTFEQQVTAAGVPQSVASLGRLALANFQWKQRRLIDCDATLAQLASAVEHQLVIPYFKAAYSNQLGLVEQERANFASAREHHLAARRIALEHHRPDLALTAQNNLGLLALRLGDYAAAQRWLQEAVDSYATLPGLQQHEGRPYAMVNLAKALEGDYDYVRAEELLSDALAVVRQQGKQDPYAQSLCLAGLAVAHYAQGRFDEAEEELQAARVVAAQTFGEANLHVAELDANLAWVALAKEDLDTAENRLRAAVTTVVDEYGPDHPRAAELMAYLARVLSQQGQAEPSRQLLRDALSLRERYLHRALGTALSERDRLALVQELRVHHESIAWPGVLDTYLELAPQLGIDIERQYQSVLDWKGVITRTAVPQAVASRQNPALHHIIDDRRRLLVDLRNAYFTRVPLRQRREHAARLTELESRADRLDQRLRTLSPQHAWQRAAGASPTSVAAALPPATALLDIIEIRRYQPRRPGEPVRENRWYVAFVVRPGMPLQRIDLGPAVPLDNAVRQLQERLEAVEPDIHRSARLLAQRIREPLAPSLAGIKLLIVSGDGWLHRLPLGVLPGSRPGSYWVDELAFAAIPSADKLVTQRRAPAENSQRSAGMLVAGGIAYDATDAAWPPLPMSENEAMAVARAFGEYHAGEPLNVLTGRGATEEAIFDLLPGRRIAHIASHGFYRGREAATSFDVPRLVSQLDSGLVLAPPGGKDVRYDRFLTAEEIGRLDLRGMDLVVLSACRTGLGHVSSGQGVIGLVAAFHQAGARSVVNTLWRVDDEATFLFMQSFYDHLWRDRLTPVAALRATQLEMIRGTLKSSDGTSFENPKYWAAFVVSGDPGPTFHEPREP